MWSSRSCRLQAVIKPHAINDHRHQQAFAVHMFWENCGWAVRHCTARIRNPPPQKKDAPRVALADCAGNFQPWSNGVQAGQPMTVTWSSYISSAALMSRDGAPDASRLHVGEAEIPHAPRPILVPDTYEIIATPAAPQTPPYARMNSLYRSGYIPFSPARSTQFRDQAAIPQEKKKRKNTIYVFSPTRIKSYRIKSWL